MWLLLPPPLCALLQARPNSIAVFVPSEITTYCFYPGLQRDYMVSELCSPAQPGNKLPKQQLGRAPHAQQANCGKKLSS